MDLRRLPETSSHCRARARRADGKTTMRSSGVRFLVCTAALLLFAPWARAEYLDDLVVSPHDRLGLSFPGSFPPHYQAVSSGGMGVVRLGVAWKEREPQPGQYEWDGLDRRIAELQALGIEPFLTLESNADWATRPETHGITNGTPIDMRDWTTFVSLTVDRYDADGWNDAPGLLRPVRFYQAVNEWNSRDNPAGGWLGTDQELIDFVIATAGAIRAAHPPAKLAMGGITPGLLDLLVLNRGMADYEICRRWGPDQPIVCRPASHFQVPEAEAEIARARGILVGVAPWVDALDLHLYGPADRDPARIQAIRAAGWRKPLLAAECGGPSLHYQDYVPEDHFMAVVERNLNDLSEGLQFCLWFRLGEGSGSSFGNSRTALFDTFLTDKPGYAAYKLLAHILKDMVSIERGAGKSFTVHRQGRPPLVVAWLEDGEQTGLLPLPDTLTGSVMRITDPVLGLYEVEPLLGRNWVYLSQWPLVAGELP